VSIDPSTYGWGTPSDAAQAEAQFDAEWDAAVGRYAGIVGIEGFQGLTLEHPTTGAKLLPHQGMAGTFSEWRRIQASYDRERLIFGYLYDMSRRILNRHQTANYLTRTRQPDRAITLLQDARPEERNAPLNAASMAYAYLSMMRPADAVSWAEKGVACDAPSRRAECLLADGLHMTGRMDEAHTIYSRLMATRSKAADPQTDVVRAMFADLFSQATGALPSPVFAIMVGEGTADPDQASAFWRMGELEFHDSPYFRMHYAYAITKSDPVWALAKLAALAQERPQIKEATLNALSLLKQLDPAGSGGMADLRRELEKRAAANRWTTDGMTRIEIGAEPRS